MKTLSNTLFQELLKTSTFNDDEINVELHDDNDWICQVNINDSIIEVVDEVFLNDEEYLLTELQKQKLINMTYDKANYELKNYEYYSDCNTVTEQALISDHY